MKRRSVVSIGIVTVALIALAVFLLRSPNHQSPEPVLTSVSPQAGGKIVVNEAVHTLLYLPLYHAMENHFFSEAGLDIRVVTGGTATNSFAALMNGDAQFSVADPMYVPIAAEKGAQATVVAQLVGRIAVWGLARRHGDVWSKEGVRNKRVATQTRPMTAFVYAQKALRDIGLDPSADVELIESKPGTEIGPLLNGAADYAFTLEPNTSIAEQKGATVVLSFPLTLGDQVFTGVMTTKAFALESPSVVESFVRALQRSLDDIHANPAAAVETAKRAFSQVEPAVLDRAVTRMIVENVLPQTVLLSEESWDRAIAVRVAAGDLKTPVKRDASCSVALMQRAAARATPVP